MSLDIVTTIHNKNKFSFLEHCDIVTTIQKKKLLRRQKKSPPASLRGFRIEVTVQNLFATISSKTCTERVHNFLHAIPCMACLSQQFENFSLKHISERKKPTKKTEWLWFVGGGSRISWQMGFWIWRNLTITQDPHIWGRTNFGPAHRVGPFKEGIGIAIEVFKVECKDLDTPGYLGGDRVRRVVGRFSIVGASPWGSHDETPGP